MGKSGNNNKTGKDFPGEKKIDADEWEWKMRQTLFRSDCPLPLELAEYKLGRLPAHFTPADKQAIEEHLLSCPYCREELKILREFKAGVFPANEMDRAIPEGEERIIPFRQAVIYEDRSAQPARAALRQDGEESPSRKITIRLNERHNLVMFFNLTRAGEGYALQGQFVPGKELSGRLENSQIEIWQETIPRCQERLTELCSFHCSLPELIPLEIRVSDARGTWIVFRLDLVPRSGEK